MNYKEFVSGKILIIILISVAFYAGILFYSDLSSLEFENIRINVTYLPVIVLIAFLLMVISGIRYHWLLQQLDIKICLKDSLLIAVIGQSMLVTPGRMGNYIKCLLLKKKLGTPISKSIPSVFTEQILELITATTLLALLVIWINFIEIKIIVLIGVGLIVFFMTLIFNSSIYYQAKKIIQKIKYIKNFTEEIEKSRESLQKLFSISMLKRSLPISFASKIIQVILVFLIFEMLEINLGVLMSGAIYNTALLLGAISFIPGGIIVTDASMLSLIMSNKINFSLATIAVLIIRFFTLWLSVIVGFIAIKFYKNY